VAADEHNETEDENGETHNWISRVDRDNRGNPASADRRKGPKSERPRVRINGVEVVAKYVSGDLACIVEVEGGRSKVGGADEPAPLALRVTTLFRLEHRA
jgi:hypothetical protein